MRNKYGHSKYNVPMLIANGRFWYNEYGHFWLTYENDECLACTTDPWNWEGKGK